MVTTTDTVPGSMVAGDTTVMLVGLVTDTDVAVSDPNFTVAPVTNPEPMTVTVVPPLVDPEVGFSDVTVGAGASLVGCVAADLPHPGEHTHARIEDVIVAPPHPAQCGVFVDGGGSGGGRRLLG